MYLKWLYTAGKDSPAVPPPAFIYGGVTGKTYKVDRDTGLILADVDANDAAKMVKTAEIACWGDVDGAQSIIAAAVGIRSGPIAAAQDVMSGLHKLAATVDGRAKLVKFFKELFTGSEEVKEASSPQSAPVRASDAPLHRPERLKPIMPSRAAAIPDGLVLKDEVQAEPEPGPTADAEEGFVGDPAAELEAKIIEAHRLKAAHSLSELRTLCRDRNLKYHAKAKESNLIAKILDLSKDWETRYSE